MTVESNKRSQQLFRKKMKSEGKKEMRGIYLTEKEGRVIKPLVRDRLNIMRKEN